MQIKGSPIGFIAQFFSTSMLPGSNHSHGQMVFWFTLSLIYPLIIVVLNTSHAFSSDYVIQDDARQHVWWMLRFIDPNIFLGDSIADFFQTVAPRGYSSLYRVMAVMGIDPLLLNKILPIALGLIATAYIFGITLQLLPVPIAGFIASLLFNHMTSLGSTVVSAGIPRSFAFPLFLGFLYYHLRRSALLTIVMLALTGLFYPPILPILLGVHILGLISWKQWRPSLSSQRSDYIICAIGIVVSILILVSLMTTMSQLGAPVSADIAKTMPEFQKGGRLPVFQYSSWHYWLTSRFTGMFPDSFIHSPFHYFSFMLCFALTLPLLLHNPRRFPLAGKVSDKIIVLPHMLVVSLVCYVLAHIVMFKLYEPSRYTHGTMWIVLTLAASISIILLLDMIIRWAQECNGSQARRKLLAFSAAGLLGAIPIVYPALVILSGEPFPKASYVVGQTPDLYRFFAKQPNDTLIATLSVEADNLPSFTGRSVLVSWETCFPYYPRYTAEFRARTTDLIRAQYTPNLATVRSIIRKYDIDFWVLDSTVFSEAYISASRWIQAFPAASSEAVKMLTTGTPALSRFVNTCSAFETKDFVVLDAKCIIASYQ